jgi:tryptophanyl-tRNA synthetase
MGNSRGNAIFLSDSDEAVAEKITAAKTDPARVHKTDPGHPEICTIYSYHQAFNAERHEEIFEDCKRGAIGCRDCKRHLTSCLNRQLLPIREKRRHYEANPHIVKELIMEGSKKSPIDRG